MIEKPTHRRPAMRTLAVIACVAAILAALPPTAARTTGDMETQVTSKWKGLTPDGGSNWYVEGRNCNTVTNSLPAPCIHVNAGGHVVYRFDLSAPVDYIDVRTSGSASHTGANCGYRLVHNGEITDIGQPCATWSDISNPWNVRFEGLFSGSFELSIACNPPWCEGFNIQYLELHMGYRALTLDPPTSTPRGVKVTGTLPTPVGFEVCVTVHATGSYWNGVDYFYITWGDGNPAGDTYIEVWEDNSGEWTRTACHTYNTVSLTGYRVTVTAHDRLGRSVQEARTVSGTGF